MLWGFILKTVMGFEIESKQSSSSKFVDLLISKKSARPSIGTSAQF